MRKTIDRLTAAALCGALIFAACGGDDDESPTAPEQDAVAGQLPPEAIALTGSLVASFQTAFFAALVADTTSVPGASGSVEIMGNTWDLQNFSPDGALFLDGTLDVQKEQFPNIPVKGDLTFSGTQQGTLSLDMLVVVEGTELSSSGTITINEVEFPVADLLTAAQSAAAAAAGE